MLSLLSSHERAETFIEQPAVNADALMAAAGADPLVGQRLGHYQIRRLLGEGGMGIVYLADDTRLGREVALKAVRAQFADDPARRARLEREAQAAAALTHPGIATVYALEEFDGRLFIVIGIRRRRDAAHRAGARTAVGHSPARDRHRHRAARWPPRTRAVWCTAI